MEGAALVVERFTLLADALLACAQSTKVLSSLWNDVYRRVRRVVGGLVVGGLVGW